MELVFTDSNGQPIILGDYFQHGKPVLLVFYYTNCPMLCSLVLNGLAKGVAELAFVPGKEFQMLAVSMDSLERPQTAAATQARYTGMLQQGVQEHGWEFLVGSENQPRKLANAIGFQYFYVPERNEYAHPAAAFVLTEDGKISRYLYGIEFKERDLRLALLEASQGKIGSTIDRILLYCYHYDPNAQGYVLLAGNVMKLGGVTTLVLLGLLLGIFWSRERRRQSV